MSDPIDLTDYLHPFVDGVGLVSLSDPQEPATASTTPEGSMAKVEITPEQKDEILTHGETEFQKLIQQAREDELTAGDVVESGISIVIYVAQAAIPGTIDDTLFGLFSSQIESFKDAASSAVDDLFKPDAERLRQRAARQLKWAEEHEAEAAEKEAEGKTGGFLSRSPQKHLERAAELRAKAQEFLAKADALDAADAD